MEKELKKQMFHNLIMLSIPTIIEQILETVVQYVDTAMVGRLGENATAAVSLTSTITWLINGLLSSFGVGILVMISRAIGERNTDKIRKMAVLSVWVTVVLGVLEGTVACALSPFIPGWMGADPGIWKNATIYFAITSATMVFRSAVIILGSAVRATGDTKTPMYVNLATNALNIGVNYLLIYTAGLGVIGAAISSAISYILGGIVMFIIFITREQFSTWRGVLDRELTGQCLQLSMPVAMTSTTACLGYVMFSSLVSGMGTVIFAAHSIAVTAETIFYIPGYGMKTAVSTLVGFSIGEKNEKKFHIVQRQSLTLTVILMCINGAILYFAAEGLMRIFTPNQEVIRLGTGVLRMIAFTEPFFGVMIIMQGIFNGIEKTRTAFWIETASMWGVRILCTTLCVKYWHLGLTAVWYCMIADNICKAVLYLLFYQIYQKQGKIQQVIEGNDLLKE